MKALKLSILLLTLYNVNLFSKENDVSLDRYISDNKKQIFSYEYEKNIADGLKLHDSWINTVNLNYSLIKSKPYSSIQKTQNASIKINQPIFQSGGIYYGIKFANISKKYADLSVDSAKRKMIKDAVSILMQIKRAEFGIQKQTLQIQNTTIKLEQKRERYMSGELDSGFLDNAIIDKNKATEALYDLQTSKQRLISKFKTISDMDYKKAIIPHLELINKEQFLEHNLPLALSKSNIEKNRYSKDITVAKYLPSISFVAGYNWQRTENQKFAPNLPAVNSELKYYNYGFSASIPININTFRDIESAKVEYLKSKIELSDKKRELLALFEEVMQNIENFDKKIDLSQENIKLYKKLLADTVKLYNAGYKTEYDVNLLKNSTEINKLDSKIFELDKQLELLNLYEMYENEI